MVTRIGSLGAAVSARPFHIAIGLAIAAGLLGISNDADSQIQDAKDQATEIRTLNDRVRRLEQRIEALERLGTARQSLQAKTLTEPGNSCATPYELVAPGVLRLKADCISWSSAASCDPPYFIDERGIRILNPACQGAEQLTGCNPPFVIDERGIKRFLPGCRSLDDRH